MQSLDKPVFTKDGNIWETDNGRNRLWSGLPGWENASLQKAEWSLTCHFSQQKRQTAAGLEETSNTWLLI